MKVLICGSRTMGWEHLQMVIDVLRSLDPKPTLIINGKARGADTIGKAAGVFIGCAFADFPADWKLGKVAGHLRNQQMLAQGPDLVLAFHSVRGISPGTRDMVSLAKAAGVSVKVITYEDSKKE